MKFTARPSTIEPSVSAITGVGLDWWDWGRVGLGRKAVLLDQGAQGIVPGVEPREPGVLAPWPPADCVYTKNRERLLNEDVMGTFLERIDGQEDPPPPPTGPGEEFGAPKEGKKRAKGDFCGIKVNNETHRSSTDIEKVLGWIMQFGGLRQFKLQGLDNASAVFRLQVLAYILIRLSNILLAQPSPQE